MPTDDTPHCLLMAVAFDTEPQELSASACTCGPGCECSDGDCGCGS